MSRNPSRQSNIPPQPASSPAASSCWASPPRPRRKSSRPSSTPKPPRSAAPPFSPWSTSPAPTCMRWRARSATSATADTTCSATTSTSARAPMHSAWNGWPNSNAGRFANSRSPGSAWRPRCACCQATSPRAKSTPISWRTWSAPGRVPKISKTRRLETPCTATSPWPNAFPGGMAFMSDFPGEITHRVREFYERCHFPGDRPLDHDGLVLTRWFAKSVAARNGAPTRVLDAGCGTGNTSVALARHYPAIQFLGVDHALSSLAQAGERAHHSGLSNLSFHHGDLMQPLAAGRFDIILCLGVLHHTADMRRVLANLRNCLNPGGHLYLWVYGKHGRYRHSLNMRLLAMLTGPASPDEALPLAREFALGSGDDSPLDDLLGRDRLDPTHRRTFRDQT